MRVLGIVGAEAAKFTSETELTAKALIRKLLSQHFVTGYSSGHCHLGGVDIWTEEIGFEFGLTPFIFPPKTLSWEKGYKPRNIQIVLASSEVHCITVKQYPESFTGMRFSCCYHCGTDDHVKSGGCWTAKYAKKIKVPATWHIIR